MDRRNFITALAAGTFFSAMPVSRAAVTADLANLDMIDTAAQISSGAISSFETTRAAMARIDRLNPQINAVITKTYDYAIGQLGRQAQRADTKNAPLAGVPYLLKDLNELAGVRTTRGSRLFSSYTSTTQSPYTDNVIATGVVMLGKTNTPEFGLMPTTEPLVNGLTRNPWNPLYSAGGSSGGSAAAVAARMVPAAQGGDGGGSLRFPAAACHLFGLKPSRGRFGDQGYEPRAVQLSIKHTISRTVRDSAFMLALTENGPGASLPPVGYIEGPSSTKRKFALSFNAGDTKPDRETTRIVKQVARKLERLWHEVEEVSTTPHDDKAFQELFTGLWSSGANQLSSMVQQMTGLTPRESGLLEPTTIKMIELYINGKQFDAATINAKLAELDADLSAFYGKYDGWISPVSPTPTPRLGYFTEDIGDEALLGRMEDFTAYTPIHNALGRPAMSIPGGLTMSGLPVGVQIAANTGAEAMLLDIAYQLEQENPWADRKPRICA